MPAKRALLVGDQGVHFLSALETAPLLKRAGFTVDIVTNNPMARHLRTVSDCVVVPQPHDLPRVALSKLREHHHDLVVVLEDFTLKDILESGLTDDDKLDLLPVAEKRGFQHLGSKVELAKLFQSRGVPSPEFAIAHDRAELLSAAAGIGYPVMVKVDFSSAGVGAFECLGPEDTEEATDKIDSWPVLVQRFIEGAEYDVSAFFQDSRLVCFSFSLIDHRVGSKFTPSSVRTYSQLALVEADVFDELQAVGNALGAHGFVNISCIRSEADGRRYYFEADMRPNAWVSSPRHIGDDPAQRIAAYFSEGRTLTHPPSIDPDLPEELAVPCFARVPLWHLAVNRSGIWKTMPEEGLLPIFLCVAELKTKDFFRNTLKPLVPAGLWSWLKACYERAKRKVMG